MSIVPVTTTRAEASVILLEALATGNLVAQSKHDAFNGGAYWLPDGTRCAIGQLFDPEDAKRLERGVDLSSPGGEGPGYYMASKLMDLRVLNVPEGEREWFETAQRLHDNWAHNAVNEFEFGPEAVARCKERFIAHIS